MKENHVWMIKEKMLEVIEALETINFVKGEPTKTTKIGMNLDISMREKNIAFLKENLDVLCGVMRICLVYQRPSSSIT